jgi:cytoskeletal protein CcmA (bactofilin family)
VSEKTNTAKNFTLISSVTKIEADLKVDHIVIYGEIKGNVESNSEVIIGKDAAVFGDVKGDEATIFGSVKGNVTINNTLLLKDTATILGNIACNKIIVEKGAVINGYCRTHSGFNLETLEEKEKEDFNRVYKTSGSEAKLPSKKENIVIDINESEKNKVSQKLAAPIEQAQKQEKKTENNSSSFW